MQLTLEFARAESAGQPHGFRFAAQTYLLRTAGGGFEAAEFPWSRALLEDLRGLRGAPDPAVAHRIGEVLREFLSTTGWSAHEQAIVAASRAGEPIRVTIRSAAAELYALPWELLVLKGPGQMLGGVPGLVVRYEWPDTTTHADVVAPADRRGRVLFAWSAAAGAVPAADHLAALQARVAGFDSSRDVIPHASFAAIAEALEAARRTGPPIDVLHLLCHGAATGATYGLALDDSDGGRVVVDAGRVQQLVAPHAGMLRTVVVAACDSGNVGELGNHLGSVAQMIHRVGVRAVVASRYPLSAAGSSRFCAALFTALRAGSLDQAFVAARDALVRDPSQLDWASVQLYARAADGDVVSPLARPAPLRRWIAVGLAVAVAAAAIAAGSLVGGAPEPAAEPAELVVVDDPAPTPTPQSVPSPQPRPQPQPTAPPPAIDPSPPIVDPPQPTPTLPDPKRPVPDRKPTSAGNCLSTPGPCPDRVLAHLRGKLGLQPELRVLVACDGRIEYGVPAPEDDTPEARARRGKLATLSNDRIPRETPPTLPCKTQLR